MNIDERLTPLADWIKMQIWWADKNYELYERIPHTHAIYQRPALIRHLAIEEAERLKDLQRMMGVYKLECVPNEVRFVEWRSAEMFKILEANTER